MNGCRWGVCRGSVESRSCRVQPTMQQHRHQNHYTLRLMLISMQHTRVLRTVCALIMNCSMSHHAVPHIGVAVCIVWLLIEALHYNPRSVCNHTGVACSAVW